jgi:transcriptional regulator GlxA family with amidase domain
LADSALLHTVPGVAAEVSWLPFGGTGWSPATANAHEVLAGVAAGAGWPDDVQPDSASAAAKATIAAQMPRPASRHSPHPPRKRTRQVFHVHPAVIDWIRSTSAKVSWTTSVCTGALLLHEAGVARGRRVATHYSFEDALQERGDVTVVRDARYVVDGRLVTSQGVSAGIDMALWLVGRMHGREHARAVRRYIQYEPAPPYLADEPAA